MKQHITTNAISYLFVPASRPERFEKALSTSADAVIIDLEDAVPSVEKDLALAKLLEALEKGTSRPALVRMNACDSVWGQRDIAALAELSAQASGSLAGVVIPMAERVGEVQKVIEVLGGPDSGMDVIALIETAVGVAAGRELASIPGVTRLAVGGADLSFDLDVKLDSSTIDWVYAQLVLDSRLAGIAAPIASPPFEIRDLELVESQAMHLRSQGLTAQLSIHPAQLDAIHRGFLPTPAEVEWAERVLAAAAEDDGAAQLDGQMIDKPVHDRASRILAQINREARD